MSTSRRLIRVATAITASGRWLWASSERRLQRQLRQNAAWCKEAQEALPLSAYFDWRSGDSDATD